MSNHPTVHHTQPPWEYRIDDKNGQPHIMADSALIAVIAHECVKPEKELHANAYLIAAAPELLEVLEYMMSAHGEQLHDAFDMAHKVISKAKGGK